MTQARTIRISNDTAQELLNKAAQAVKAQWSYADEEAGLIARGEATQETTDQAYAAAERMEQLSFRAARAFRAGDATTAAIFARAVLNYFA